MSIYIVYILTHRIHVCYIPQMLAYIPDMDPMGYIPSKSPKDIPVQSLVISHTIFFRAMSAVSKERPHEAFPVPPRGLAPPDAPGMRQGYQGATPAEPEKEMKTWSISGSFRKCCDQNGKNWVHDDGVDRFSGVSTKYQHSVGLCGIPPIRGV